MGLDAVALGLLGFSGDAFDYNNDAIAIGEQLLEKVRSAGYDASVNSDRDDLLNIQSPAETYDLVFYKAVLEYFCDTDERMRVWQEMTRVTKIAGWGCRHRAAGGGGPLGSRCRPVGPRRQGRPVRFPRDRAGRAAELSGPRSHAHPSRHVADDLLALGEGQSCVPLHPAHLLSPGPSQDTGVALES